MVLEPVLDISQPLMTLIAWTILFFITLPATIYDEMSIAAANCKSEFGEGWEALSPYAVTGRGNPMLAMEWDKSCYNPTDCGIIPIKNTNHDSTEAAENYFMAYQYKAAPPAGDTSALPGFALYAVPLNGARWIEGNFPFDKVLGIGLSHDGWYASSLPWMTSDG